ncbi:SLBB domain-containing protein [Emcibacter sp.]|uniref:SLBB domain-containing protein n=1 Tax=Emcibacter sp. TaxID=1979954 RepID=UPI002AA6EC58|nr:SLBB domain-containing protein [Emcibacter sp.]
MFFAQSATAQFLDESLLENLRQKAGNSSQPTTITSPLDHGREQQINYEREELQKARYEELSRLEEDFQARLSNEELLQFGYALFEQIPRQQEVITGSVSDNYILGVGDELVVTFQGSKSSSYSVKVDRNGRVILPDVKPLTVVGRTLGETRKNLEDLVADTMIGTNVYVSLASFRMISVIVAGEVFEPGVIRTTSLSSGLEVLLMSGGVKKTGSLRNIKVYRGHEVFTIDLYRLLLGQQGIDIPLMDGDRIVVPVIGPTIAVDGDVVRPGIYELRNNADGISFQKAIALAGGTIRPRGYSFSHVTMDKHGRQTFEEVTGDIRIHGSEALLASLRENSQLGKVELLGHVKAPGVRSLASASSLRKMLGSVDNLEDDPYMLFGAIDRVDETTRSRKLIEFSPRKVLLGGQDIELKDRDRVVFFGRKDIGYLISGDVRKVILTGEYTGKKSLKDQYQRQNYCAPLDNLARIIADSQSERFATAVRAVFVRKGTEEEKIRDREKLVDGDLRSDVESNILMGAKGRTMGELQQEAVAAELQKKREQEDKDYEEVLCPSVFNETLNLLPFILEYVVSVDGAVRQPGVYPIVRETTLEALLSVSGGLSNDANKTRIEVANYTMEQSVNQLYMNWDYVDSTSHDISNILINPGGGVRVSSLFSNFEPGAVLLSGEFREPGVYTIRKGEKLSDLIVRAGGFTDQAYPYGAIFTRKRVKELQQAQLRQTAQSLQSAMVSASVKKNIDADSLMAAQQLTDQLASAEVIGRVVIEADPVKLLLDPAKDIVLEAGDALYIPKRPNFIVAVGDVLNPGALQFVSGKGVAEYLNEVGSFTRSADEDRVYIVYPNGVARPVNLSSWGGDNNLSIPPGTAIVVPTDLSPYDTLTLVKEIGSIVSSLAVSAASLAVIFTN